MKILVTSFIFLTAISCGDLGNQTVTTPQQDKKGIIGEQAYTADSQSDEEVVEGVMKEKFFIEMNPGEKNQDFLFVLDSSDSMSETAKSVAESLVQTKWNGFKSDLKFAVKTTLVANSEGGVHELHSQGKYEGQEFEPGFMGVVNSYALKNFMALPMVLKGIKDRYPEPGCNGWFSSSEKNENDVSCFTSHFQISATRSRCKPFLKSVMQYVSSQGEQAFRKGAYINIVIVSNDTSMGCFKEMRESESKSKVTPFVEMQEYVKKHFPSASGLKFHGILPNGFKCNPGQAKKDKRDNPFSLLISEGGGVQEDICLDNAPEKLMTQILEDKGEAQMTVSLNKEPSLGKIAVYCNGRKTDQFKISGKQVTFLEKFQNNVTCEVEYR